MNSKFGDYRLKLYELLYSNPLCNYIYTDPSKAKKISVLILGSGWVGCEAFKSVFWAGQCGLASLEITVASQNADELEAAAYETMPAIRGMCENDGFAKLDFKKIDDVSDPDQLEALCFDENVYTYVIISLGDSELNYLVADVVREMLLCGNGGYDKFSVNVFDENGTPSEECSTEIGGQVRYFGDSASSVDKDDLKRIAENINLVYSMEYDPSASVDKVNETFENDLDSLYRKRNVTGTECRDILGYFKGYNYNADSSYACAVHIPYKLAFAGSFGKKSRSATAPMERFGDAITKKNELYERLVALEHKRWMAYMATWGFRAPSADETDYLYVGNNDHRMKTPKGTDKQLFHMCMFDCGDRGLYLHKNRSAWTDPKWNEDGSYSLWSGKRLPSDGPSLLDRASLYCYKTVSEKAREVSEGFVKSTFGEQLSQRNGDIVFRNLSYSINKLFANDDNSIKLYESAMSAAVSAADADTAAMLGRLKSRLSVVVARNRRLDFSALDAAIIEMTPFCSWYGSKYSSVITFGSGNAYRDIIAPTLLCAREAVFVGDGAADPAYQKSITDYFRGRGDNTRVTFDTRSVSSVDQTVSFIEKYIDGRTIEDFVVNLVPSVKNASSVAAGVLSAEYAKGIPVVQYVPGEGLVCYNKKKYLFAGINNKSISVEEFISLLGGSFSNVYKLDYDRSRHEDLTQLFKKYYPCEDEESKKIIDELSNTWIAASGFLSRACKDLECALEPDIQGGKLLHYSGRFLNSVFSTAGMNTALTFLQTYRIIVDLKIEKNGRYCEVSFDYVNKGIEAAFDVFEADHCKTVEEKERAQLRKIKFLVNSGLKISDLCVDAVLTEAEGSHKEGIKEYLRDLDRYGFIRDLKIDEGDRVRFVFIDEETKNLLRSQGSVFELVLCHKLRGTSLDDVQTGVKIAWNSGCKDYNTILSEAINAQPKNKIGYGQFKDIRGRVNGEIERGVVDFDPENEIDVIGVKGMEVLFVSCKTGGKITSNSKNWIYEICSVSNHFGAYGMLAVAKEFNNRTNGTFTGRARQMGVSLIGFETLWNDGKVKKTVGDVLRGKTVSVLD